MKTVAGFTRWAALTAAGLSTVLTAIVVSTQEPIAYASQSLGSGVATVGVASALVVAGVANALHPPNRRLSPLLAALAIAWVAPVWVGWHEGPPLLRSVGAVVAPAAMPVLIHLLASGLNGGRWTTLQRRAVAGGYALAALVLVGLAILRDPFFDLYCWNNCTTNVFLISSVPDAARALGLIRLWSWVIVPMLAIVLGAWALTHSSPAARAAAATTAIPAAMALVAEGCYAALLIVEPGEGVEYAPFLTAYFARAVALLIVALGAGWGVLREIERRRAVARLADELAVDLHQRPLSATLSVMLEDPSVQVSYWLPDSKRFVDSSGRTLEPDRSAGRTRIEIRRGGQLVALVSHGRGMQNQDDLVGHFGAAARLAIDNERLQAGVLAQLFDLRTSRLRVIDAADTARLAIERNLHDGAQQSLIALLYALSLARADAFAAGERRKEEELVSAIDAVRAVVRRLRLIAHGVFPAVLEQAGLAGALPRVAEDAELPVDIVLDAPERFPALVERAAYLAVRAAVDAAEHSPTSQLRVKVFRRADDLVVAVEGVPFGDFESVADRVGALGGIVESLPGRLEAAIPCA